MKLKQLFRTVVALAFMTSVILPASATKVTINGLNSPTVVNKASGVSVETTKVKTRVYTMDCPPGIYTVTPRTAGAIKGQPIDVTVGQPGDYDETEGLIINLNAFFVRVTNGGDGQGTNGVWVLHDDYELEDIVITDEDGKPIEVTYEERVEKGIVTGIQFTVNGGFNFSCRAVPDRKLHPDYIETSQTLNESRTGWSIEFMKKIEFKLSYPADAKAELSRKKSSTHYVAFEKYEPERIDEENGIKTSVYKLLENNDTYCYRVSREGSMTHAGLFQPIKTNAVEITDGTLSLHTNRYFTHDVWGNGTNYADIFLNINRRNLLRMESGKTFQIVNLRTWQLTNSQTANYFIEPDYSWTVLNTDFKPDNSVVEVDSNGVLTAKAPGTAIVQVRYDAMNLGAMAGQMWSEIWAENTGTFVVTVDADPSKAPADNIRLDYKPEVEIDAEHDIMYYMDNMPGYYLTFTPAPGSKVTVANPLVDTVGNNVAYPNGFSDKNVTANPDGSVTALLTFGRNIIRTVDGDGNANFQVLSAKPVSCEIVNLNRGGTTFLPGDDLQFKFKGFYHVAGKLAGIYNQNCTIEYNGKSVTTEILSTGQYDFAGNAKAQTLNISIPTDAENEFTLGHGRLVLFGYGSDAGTHRAISYETGVDPNFNAGNTSMEFGGLPNQTVEVTTIAEGLRISMELKLGTRKSVINPDVVTRTLGNNIRWESKNTGIAKFNSHNELVAVAPGETTVFAFADDKTTPAVECAVKVIDDPDYVALQGIAFNVGNKTTFAPSRSWGNWGNQGGSPLYLTYIPENATNTIVNFTSSNPDVLEVRTKHIAGYGATPNGYSRADLYWVGDGPSGTSVVTAVSDDGEHIAICEVDVITTAISISLDRSEAELNVGDELQLTATTRPTPVANTPVWSSSAPDVASVDDNGNVRALKEGTATVSAKVDGRTANCEIAVKGMSGIEEITTPVHFAFYPNPCHGTLHVDVNENGELEIYNLHGIRMMRTKVASGSNTLDLSCMTKGLYILVINGRAERLIVK